MKKSELEATIDALMQENQQLKGQLDIKISACDALPLLQHKDEEIGRMQIELNRYKERIAQLEREQVTNDWR
jgi:FtsZ-binding cell division protein ZapB